MLSPWRESRRRRVAWFGLIFAVLVAHAMFALRVVSSVIGWNAAPEPKRIEITFSKQVKPTTPLPVAVVAAPPPPPAPRPPRPVRAARASSEPASAPEPPEEAASSASHAALLREALALAASAAAPASAASAEGASASAAVASASAAAPHSAASSTTVALPPVPSPEISISVTAGAGVSAPVAAAGPPRPSFAWPPSTRLTYTLTGLYRNGPLYGKASVEWRLVGTHYQVQFDIHVSPFFDQHMFSDGQVTDQGLSPRHYDESFEVPFVAPRVRRIEFSEDEVTLANGNRVIRLPETQDGASQFVQFVWMFTQRPELLRTGNVVDIPLALNSNLRRWHYQVVGPDTLLLPFGQLDAVHLRPLLEGPRRPNEYPFEIWTAPSLQYLPVRILVPIDDKNFADLSLDALPLQAAGVPEDEAASRPLLR